MIRRILLTAWALALATASWAQTLTANPFSSASLWNTRIPAGSTYHTLAWPTATGFNYSVAWDSFSPGVYFESLSDPLVAAVYSASWGYPAGTLNIHIPAGVTGAPGSDAELLVVGLDNNVYDFEGFNRTNNNNATASFLAWTPITASGFGSYIPFLGAGVNAIGASQLGGLLNEYDQAQVAASQPITHAISIETDVPLTLPGFIQPPAISGDGNSASGIVTEGQKLGIPPTTPMPTLSFDGAPISPLGAAVFTAMQNYGVIVNDRAIGDSAVSMQFNAWDAPTVTRMVQDIQVIMPLLESYTPGTVTRPPQMTLLGVGP